MENFGKMSREALTEQLSMPRNDCSWGLHPDLLTAVWFSFCTADTFSKPHYKLFIWQRKAHFLLT